MANRITSYNKNKRTDKYIGAIPIIFIIFALVIPLLFLVYYAFFSSATKPAEPFYYYLLNKPYSTALLNTFIISLKVAFCSTIISVFITYSITISKKKIQSILVFVVITSMWLSVLVRSYAWILILQKNGLINSFISLFLENFERESMLYNQNSVVIGMVHILAPYVILIQWAGLRNKISSLIPVSNSIGGTNSFYFFIIYIPSSLKYLLIGGIVVFILSIGYYITPLLLGKGSGDSLMTTMLIEEQINILANWKVGALISFSLLILFSIIFGIMISISYFKKYLCNFNK